MKNNNWFGSDLLSAIGNTTEALQPLATTMSSALRQAGINPPSELTNLALTFEEKIVRPISPGPGGSLGSTIIDFVRAQMTAKNQGQKLPPVLNTVAKGGNSVLNRLENQAFFSDLFSNPFVVVGIVAIMGLVAYLIVKK